MRSVLEAARPRRGIQARGEDPFDRGPWARVAAAGLALVALSACGPAPPAPPPAPPPPTSASSPPSSSPVDVEAAKRAAAEEMKAGDARAEAMLAAFRARVWDPGRDGLRSAAGEVTVVADGRRGVYRFSFDGTLEDDAQVTLTTESADEGIHAGAHAQAKRFAILSLRGPYHTVVSALPPIEMRVEGAEEGPGRIVVAPPFRTPVGTSYRFGTGDLVDLRGETDGKQKEIARFSWLDWQGKAVLLRTDFGDEARTTGETASVVYEYADRDGFPALARATLVEGGHRFEAALSYSSWVRK